eukprot:gene908-4747_t
MERAADVGWEAWTDGSVLDGGIRRGGAGGIILQRGGGASGALVERDRFAVAAGAVASSYTAELHAIREALRRLRGLLPAGPVRVLLATDSQSAVRALCGGPAAQHGSLEQDVWRLLRSIFHGDRELILQWVS